MKLIKIDKDNMVNGPGVRQVLWFAGCSHHCPHCHNLNTWSPLSGDLFTEDTINKIIDLCDNEYTSGLTLTGGDPFFADNLQEMFDFLKKFRERLPEKTIWCWTGYTYEQIKEDSNMFRLLKFIDVLVDGKFDWKQREKDLKLPNYRELLKYRGSTNQRVIDVKKSLTENKIILYCE